MPPQGRGANPNDCKVSDYKADGNKVTWSMTCEGRQPMTGKGEFLYAENAYTGTMTMDMQGRGGMTMNTRASVSETARNRADVPLG